MVEVVGDDRKLAEGRSFRVVIPHIREALTGGKFPQVRIEPAPVAAVSLAVDLVVKLMDVYRQETGRTEDKPMSIGGGTYAKSMPNVLAFGPVLPDEPSNIHEANECWDIDNMMTSAKIMGAAILALAKD